MGRQHKINKDKDRCPTLQQRANVSHMSEPTRGRPCGTATYGSVRLLPGVAASRCEHVATNQSLEVSSSGVRRDPPDGRGGLVLVPGDAAPPPPPQHRCSR